MAHCGHGETMRDTTTIVDWATAQPSIEKNPSKLSSTKRATKEQLDETLYC